MQITNNDNTQLIEFFEGLEKGFAIEQTYNALNYEFYKEMDVILVKVNGDTAGHLELSENRSKYETAMFEDWDNNHIEFVEWLDELDAYIQGYEV